MCRQSRPCAAGFFYRTQQWPGYPSSLVKQRSDLDDLAADRAIRATRWQILAPVVSSISSRCAAIFGDLRRSLAFRHRIPPETVDRCAVERAAGSRGRRGQNSCRRTAAPDSRIDFVSLTISCSIPDRGRLAVADPWVVSLALAAPTRAHGLMPKLGRSAPDHDRKMIVGHARHATSAPPFASGTPQAILGQHEGRLLNRKPCFGATRPHGLNMTCRRHRLPA